VHAQAPSALGASKGGKARAAYCSKESTDCEEGSGGVVEKSFLKRGN
jgi:hypothetical protein